MCRGWAARAEARQGRGGGVSPGAIRWPNGSDRSASFHRPFFLCNSFYTSCFVGVSCILSLSPPPLHPMYMRLIRVPPQVQLSLVRKKLLPFDDAVKGGRSCPCRRTRRTPCGRVMARPSYRHQVQHGRGEARPAGMRCGTEGRRRPTRYVWAAFTVAPRTATPRRERH